MDAFWCITLSVIVISIFWKRETIRNKDRQSRKEKLNARIEQEKQQEVIRKYTSIFCGPLTEEEKRDEQIQKELEKRRKAETEKLKKEGYSDELIAVILPTINNGQ